MINYNSMPYKLRTRIYAKSVASLTRNDLLLIVDKEKFVCYTIYPYVRVGEYDIRLGEPR